MYGVSQLFDVGVALGADAYDVCLREECAELWRDVSDVSLVVDDDEGFVFAEIEDVFSLFFCWHVVEHPDDDCGLVDFSVCPVDSELLYSVFSVSYSGSVDESESPSFDDGGVFDYVSCCAVYVAYDSPFFSYEQV